MIEINNSTVCLKSRYGQYISQHYGIIKLYALGIIACTLLLCNWWYSEFVYTSIIADETCSL